MRSLSCLLSIQFISQNGLSTHCGCSTYKYLTTKNPESSPNMGEHIQPMHIPISMKNIGIPSEIEYQKALVFRIEDFIRKFRWHCFFIGPPVFNPVMFNKNSQCAPTQNSQPTVQSQDKCEDETPEFEKQQWYGFKSENSPTVIKELIRFEEELYKLSRSIKFRKIPIQSINLTKSQVTDVLLR